DDPGALDDPLETRAGVHELLVLLVRAEAHHPLDAGAVVPRAVEEDHLAGRGQLGDVALEVPLGLLPIARGAEGDVVDHPRVGPFGDPTDRAALAGRIAALEEDDDFEALMDDPFLQPDQLDLQAAELLFVALLVEDLGVGHGDAPEAASG